MIILQIKADEIRTDKFNNDNEHDNHAHGQYRDRKKCRPGSDGVIDDGGACILIRSKNRSFVIIHHAFFKKVLCHESADIGAGKTGYEGKSGYARNSQEETEEWLEKLAGSLQGS